ncbi:MAG: AAA family ATPase [Saprospiraceae bacterium]|nr:AAA family ATPase [Saprospiraceae bacterium]
MIEKEPLILSNEFNEIIELFESSKDNYFLTGRAGTGKSTLLQLFKNTTKKNVIVLAPTGIAALNVGGQTIHSFFGLPPRIISVHDIPKRTKKFRSLYEKIDTIVIDEISMVRADLLDNIDASLRINRQGKEHLPFGGVQVIFFGDMFQLPPVVSSMEEKAYFNSHYQSPYFFSSAILKSNFKIQVIELTKVYRQEETFFLKFLDRVRTNQVDYEDLLDINKRHITSFDSDDLYVTLTTTNAISEQINQQKLNGINNPEVVFSGSVSGSFDTMYYPTDLNLRLKLGAQILFLKNDVKKRYVNGTIAKIVELTPNKIVAQTTEGNLVEVSKFEWEIKKYILDEKNPQIINSEVIGTFSQYPIKLAWAMTIHKSQGKTFDKVIIDLGRGAFEFGQTYVALSRCRTLEGIILKRPINFKDIFVDERIVSYYETYLR